MYKYNFSKVEFGKIISNLAKALDIQVPTVNFDETAGKNALKYFEEMDWPEKIRDFALSTALWVARSFQIMYPHLDAQTNYYITIDGIYAFIIDDFGREFGDALYEFEPLLVGGKEQNHPVLQSYAEFMTTSTKYVGRHASLRNTISTLRFINACIIERVYGEKISPLSHGALNFPEYLRADSGGADGFGTFVFPEKIFPEKKYLHKYISVIYDVGMYNIKLNDVLAFYKETVLSDEKLLYVSNIAHANDISVMEALNYVSAEVVQMVKNIRYVLANEPELLAAANSFIDGTFAWHVVNDERYHLSDIPILDDDGKNLVDKYDGLRKMMDSVAKMKN